MDHPLVIVLLTLLAVGVLRLVFALLISGGDFGRVMFTVRTGFRLLRDPEAARKVQDILETPETKGPAKPSGAPLRLLSLLQREGRLVDFLQENIQEYANEQIGAAVRDIHEKCRHTLKEHLEMEPVLAQAEGSTVEIPAGFDPSAIRLIGNVTGQPPFRGTLQHHGWRVRELKLATPAPGVDEFIVMPAEVELP